MKRWTLLWASGAVLAFSAALAISTPASALESDGECAVGDVICDTIYIPVCEEYQLEPFECLRWGLSELNMYEESGGGPPPVPELPTG